MSIKDIENCAKELQELRRMREELDAEIAALEEQIKAEMGEKEQLVAGAFKISWKTITTKRLDSKAIVAAIPDFCESYMKTSTIRRFTIA